MVYNGLSGPGADALDAVFGALSDRTRRSILERLSRRVLTIGELAASYEMSLPAVSKHIRVLERAGLASIERDGRVRRCALIAEPLREAAGWVERYRAHWESRFDELAAYLEETRERESEG